MAPKHFLGRLIGIIGGIALMSGISAHSVTGEQAIAAAGASGAAFLAGEELSRKIQSLSFRGAQLDTSDLSKLVEYPRLRGLDLSGTRIDDEGLRVLARIGSLEKLALSGCTNITDDGIMELAELPMLRSVSMYDLELPEGRLQKTGVSANGWRRLTTVPSRIRVLGLSLSPPRIEDVTRVTFAGRISARQVAEGASDLKNAEIIDLADGSNVSLVLGAEQQGGKARILYLENSDVRDTDIVDICRCERLTDLDLSGTSITDEGLEQLASLSHLRRLFICPVTSPSGTTHAMALSEASKQSLRKANPKLLIIDGERRESGRSRNDLLP